MKKTLNLVLCATILSAPLLAIAAPGVGGDVIIKNNKAGKITATGGDLKVGIGPFKGGELNMTTAANVNSVVVNGGEIKGKVTVVDNTAKDVTATGAMVNVNSLVVNAKK